MKPYNQTESKKEQVRTMFDGIARRYDLLNHLLSLGIDRGWRRRVVRMVRLHRPAEILDMATGTGDLAIMLAEACPAAQITGIDLSERMLAIGREKVERKGLSGRIRLSQGDAETPRYGEGRFDAATVAFGVRNFEDLPGGMTGLYRALKPGGRISQDGAAYAYLPESVGEFPYGKRFTEILRDAGFRNARFKNLFGGVAQIYSAEKPVSST